MDKVRRTETEWRDVLSPEEYRVLRQAGTEAPFTGEYTDTKTEGVYRCRACGAELFRSDAKFESHCGWPSFYQPTEDDAVILIEDNSLGMRRVEVRCANCESHLGHVFEGEGYEVPTDQRWCINSVSPDPGTRRELTASRPPSPARRSRLPAPSSAAAPLRPAAPHFTRDVRPDGRFARFGRTFRVKSGREGPV